MYTFVAWFSIRKISEKCVSQWKPQTILLKNVFFSVKSRLKLFYVVKVSQQTDEKKIVLILGFCWFRKKCNAHILIQFLFHVEKTDFNIRRVLSFFWFLMWALYTLIIYLFYTHWHTWHNLFSCLFASLNKTASHKLKWSRFIYRN